MQYWLMKTEPGTFSLNDLRSSPNGTAPWDGVRNYQARNHMRDGMKLGDGVLIYHSSTEHRAIVGRARVAREAYPDHTAWNPGGDHFDPRSTRESPVWLMVDITFEEEFPRPLLLDEMHGLPDLAGLMLLRRGMRLSIQPVSPEHFQAVLAYARAEKVVPAAATASAPVPAQAAAVKPARARPAQSSRAARGAKRSAAQKATAKRKPANERKPSNKRKAPVGGGDKRAAKPQTRGKS